FSTGLKNIDYRITDNFADPKNTTEHLHSETLVRLEPSFLCYKPDKKTPICQNLPIENNEYITFGSFNNFSKLSKSTLQTWARILSSVKNSRLLLKNSISTSDLLKQNLLITFKEFGIDQNRIEFHQNINSRDEHMSYYNNVDICLDPFPYNGTTTTFEAIYMGVPVISLSGESHYSRVGFSILSNLKLNELIASSTEKYVEIAQNLSADVSRIKKYRCSLRETLLTSPLTDAKSFSDNFERLLRETWYSYCENNI
ncbi:MAG: hypothetical protein OEM38_05265, partial [Gammaproteobacteria bacterium]|nr:hypothetical protein [Gammaproteobacteria bacterium]